MQVGVSYTSVDGACRNLAAEAASWSTNDVARAAHERVEPAAAQDRVPAAPPPSRRPSTPRSTTRCCTRTSSATPTAATRASTARSTPPPRATPSTPTSPAGTSTARRSRCWPCWPPRRPATWHVPAQRRRPGRLAAQVAGGQRLHRRDERRRRPTRSSPTPTPSARADSTPPTRWPAMVHGARGPTGASPARAGTWNGRTARTTSADGYVPNTGRLDLARCPTARRRRWSTPSPTSPSPGWPQALGRHRRRRAVSCSGPRTGPTCSTPPPATSGRATPTARSRPVTRPRAGGGFGQSGFQEGNAAQYTWMVPQNLRGADRRDRRQRGGGHRLDTFFTAAQRRSRTRPYHWQGNEPTFDTPWAVRQRRRAVARRRRTVRRIARLALRADPRRRARQRRPRRDDLLVRLGGAGPVPADAGRADAGRSARRCSPGVVSRRDGDDPRSSAHGGRRRGPVRAGAGGRRPAHAKHAR